MPARKPKAPPAPSDPAPLAPYHRKRDFTATPEPRGARAAGGKRLRFVVQKHHASRLHYDFRLEADGVLKSWAVPKGPSRDPADKRLAMHVEDHPLDYRTFEGIIPKGNYGAGEVIVWDLGTYVLAEGADAAAEIANGKIKFILRGKKLNGEFTLVRIKNRTDETGDPWLLIKDHDEFVDTAYEIEADDRSAKSGKTLAQIAADPRAPHWASNRNVRVAPVGAQAKQRAKRDPVPTIADPMLATMIGAPFDDDAWLFEIKWDGYRAICTVTEAGGVTLVSRNGLDFLPQFPELAELGSAFTSRPIVVDGEIVSLDERGRSSFQRLQGSFNRKRPSTRGPDAKHNPVTFVAFDLLYGDGKDMRKVPLEARKEKLKTLIAGNGLVLFSKHIVGEGTALFEQARDLELEGIIGKRRDSLYVQRRSRDWVKIKAQLTQEAVIGGYTEPRGSRSGFGALLLGLYDGKAFRYAGHVGTGFDTKMLAKLSEQLKRLERKTSPFDGAVETTAPAHWVKPQLVAEVRFTEWTRDGVMRQPAFLGLRVDKNPKDCKRELAAEAGPVT